MKSCKVPFAILIVGWIAVASSVANDRPNVVLITVDDMNCDSVGAFGCPIPEITPHIDRLASEGMRFEHAHVTIAICQPTRAVWMTGRYPHRSGALGFDPIRSDVPTLVEAVHAAGFYTGILSKEKHVVPTRKDAWDHRVKMADLGYGRDSQRYYEECKRVIENARSKDQPFFLMANIDDPHRPFVDSAQEAKQIKRGKKFPAAKGVRRFDPNQIPLPGFLPDLKPIRKEIAQYFSSVYRADQSVGSVLKAIDDTDEANNTFVIFMSDHGMALPFAKTNCWRHSTRTPWIVRWPDQVKPSSHDTDHVISGIDLAPTILDAVGLPNLEAVDGRSIVSILKGQKQSDRDYVITHINRTSGKNEYPMRSVVGRKYGYIYNGWSNGKTIFKNESQNGLTMKAMKQAAKSDPLIQERVDLFLKRCPEEFYNYQSDPDALTNLIDVPKHAKTISELKKRLLDHMVATGDPQKQHFVKHHISK